MVDRLDEALEKSLVGLENRKKAIKSMWLRVNRLVVAGCYYSAPVHASVCHDQNLYQRLSTEVT